MVNQPSASVTELGVRSKELRRGESFSLMKETSVLIESGSSPAARDRPRRLIHISCFAPLQQDKAQCKRWGSSARCEREPRTTAGGQGRGAPRAGLCVGWGRGAAAWLGDVPGKLRSVLTRFRVLASEDQQSSGLHRALLHLSC